MRIKNRISIIEWSLTILVVVITACQLTSSSKNNKKNKTSLRYSINLEDAIKTKEKVAISEIANNIKYIPLETTTKSLLGDINKVIISDTNIYIGGNQGLKKFSLGGEFIGKIGQTGRGPGEYMNLGNFGITKKLNIIIIFDANSQKILWYNENGDFIKQVNKSLNGDHFVFFDNNKIALYSSKILVQPDSIVSSLIITDSYLNIIKTIPNIIQRTGKWSIASVPLYIFNDNLYYKDCFNDTLYHLNSNNLRLEKYAVIKLGNYQLPAKIKLPLNQGISKLIEITKRAENKLTIRNIFESNKYLIFKLLYGFGIYKNDPLFVLFAKDRNIVKALSGNGFINDLDGGLNFTPASYININNQEYLIGWVNAFKLKEHVASAAFKSSTPKYPEKKKELEKLANSLKDDDNPVLMLVKLKE